MTTLAAALLAPCCLMAAFPKVIVPFDENPTVFNGRGEPCGLAVVSGKSNYVDGVDGKALAVQRIAYDQVTAVNLNKLPELNAREGTVSFFFRPNWERKDGKSYYLFQAGKWRSDFFLIFVKDARGQLELSVCTPKQRQLFVKNPDLKAGKWVHITFSWNLAKGEQAIYLDGKPAARKSQADWKEPGYSFNGSWDVWLGKGGSDRFKAEVAEGAFDSLKIYDVQLSDNEVLADFLGSYAKTMRPVPVEQVRRNEGKLEFRFSAPVKRFPNAQPLLSLKSGKSLITVSSTGASGKLTLNGGGKLLDSPYVINLTRPLKLSIRPEGRKAGIWFDDAFQGDLELPGGWSGLDSVNVTEGVTLSAPEFSEKEFASLKRKAAGELEKRLWDLGDAQKVNSGVRQSISLNGYWRMFEDDSYAFSPVVPAEQRYVRIPGSRRSSCFQLYRGKNGKLESLNVQEGPRTTADWYQRTFKVPEEWKGRRIFLNFENLNADYGRVYLNGKLIESFRQDYKSFAAVPNARRIEVTDLLEEENVLSVFLTHFIRLYWRNLPDMRDTWNIVLCDAWLEAGPSPVFVKSAVAFPSVRKGTLEMRATVENPRGVKGDAELTFRYRRAGSEKSFSKKFRLDGSGKQRIVFTEPWKNPVLWSEESPELYAQSVTLSVNGKTADMLPERDFGFRELWVENGEFRLNGFKKRFRMSTNPQFDSLNMYLSHPRAVAQYVAQLKRMNFDSVRFNPSIIQRNAGYYNTPAYLRECGRQGISNFFPMPFYEGDDMAQYRGWVENYLEFFGAFPSIVLWYTDFNTCSYPACQDPYYLNNTSYVPKERVLKARKLVEVADRTMRSLDPSRECVPHAAGNFGKVFGSMNYQSFGTPLQEQEDWPKIWSEKHSQPLVSFESSFPYPLQYTYFDGPIGHYMTAEHAARYFGDSVFRDEIAPVQFGQWFRFSPVTPNSVNYIRGAAEMCRRVIRSWRAYDISSLGDFTSLHELFRLSASGCHHPMYWEDDDNVKQEGLRPDNHVALDVVQDFMQLEDFGRLVQREYSPLRVFLAGDPDDFTNKDHAFFSNETFRKSIVVVNDRMSEQKLRFRWTFTVGGKTVDGGELSENVAPGAILKLPVNLTAPEVAARTEGKLSLDVFLDDKGYDTDEFAVQVFPRTARPDFRFTEPAGLYDPAGKTAALLEKAGYPFRKVSTADEVRSCRVLIIGQNALGKHVPGFLKEMERSGDFRIGKKILFFEQQPCNLANFVFESPSSREAFIRRGDSPYIQGLTDADFRDWRGSSDTRPAKHVSNPDTTFHYPRDKWKIGNGGMVAGNVIRKPSYGHFRTIVDCGFNLMFSALMDYKNGRGYALFCQLDVTSRYGKDPVATRIVDNILTEFANPALPISNQAAIYYGDAENEAALKRLGVGCVKGNPYDPNGFLTKGVVILGRNAVPKEMRERFRKNFEAYLSGGLYAKGIIVCLPGAPLDLLPVPMSTEKKLMFRAELPANDPLFAGMTEADFYFRTARQLNAVKAPDWTVAARPAVLARTGFHQGGAIIYVGFTPDMFEDAFWNREKATRIWNTLFANLNLPLKQNLSLFGNTRMRHNTVIPESASLALTDGFLKLDPRGDGKVSDAQGFKPYRIGIPWEKQGFTQPNPHYKYPANAPADMKKPYDGYAWIRVPVRIPADWKSYSIRLSGGPVDDADETWFNGVKIGETTLAKHPDSYSRIRNYPIPSSAIRFGEENILMIRVFDRWGFGGVTGPLRLLAEEPQSGPTVSPYVEKLDLYDVDAFHNW